MPFGRKWVTNTSCQRRHVPRSVAAFELICTATSATSIQALNTPEWQTRQDTCHTARYPCSINQRTFTNLLRVWVIHPTMDIFLSVEIPLNCNKHSTCMSTSVSWCESVNAGASRIFVIDKLDPFFLNASKLYLSHFILGRFLWPT